MSGLYLVELANWLRTAGLIVVEYGGWQQRARSSGGYTGNRPWCVMWHHTASDATPDSDAAYMAEGSSDAPIANLLIARDGVVWVIAAGATNTNGKGYAMDFTRGRVPNDQMNTHAIGVEIANNGVGEPYPVDQIDAAFAASLCICWHLGLAPDDVGQHWDWAPDRKIDPATAAAVQGPWRPGSVTSSGTWSLADLRDEMWRRASAPPPIPLPDPTPTPPSPGPPIGDDDMRITTALDNAGTIWVGNGIHRHALTSMDVFNNYVVLGAAGCFPFVNTSGQTVRELGHVQTVGDVTIEAMGVPI